MYVTPKSCGYLNFVPQVHMEADRKAMSNETGTPLDPLIHAKVTYKIKDKVSLYFDNDALLSWFSFFKLF